jgi:hypothetical protein
MKPEGTKLYTCFEDWFSEREGFGLRAERYDGDIAWLREAFAAGRSVERERSAGIAEMFILEKNTIHPDIPFENLLPDVVTVAHTTCQHIAAAIRKGG